MAPNLPTNLPTAEELRVERIGTPSYYFSPLGWTRFTDDEHGVLVSSDTGNLAPYFDAGLVPPAFEEAGARRRLFVDPRAIACGIVTCGGLCPGLNDVIRAVVLGCRELYGVPRVLGYRYGFAGLVGDPELAPLELDSEAVHHINELGGTVLGSSRGPQDVGVMVDTLVRDGVRVLFCLGGDGTLKGASAIAAEIARRNLEIAVVGIPKTIDNDLFWVERTFGFATAVEEATKAIRGAAVEARGAWNGIGLVKLMGRHSGFIAASAVLATGGVDVCLVPEVPFDLEGDDGLFAVLERRLARHHRAVVVVAEGAGQDLTDVTGLGTDASGNRRLADVGTFLRDRIRDHFSAVDPSVTIKYIDPSYLIRSLPANGFDSEFCAVLGQEAVHAGLAGRTNLVIGYWHHHFTHLPIALATQQRLQIDPTRELWNRVLLATGQPAQMHQRS